jgi:hypothetical protein
MTAPVEADGAHRRPGHFVTGHDLTGECTERAANLVDEQVTNGHATMLRAESIVQVPAT